MNNSSSPFAIQKGDSKQKCFFFLAVYLYYCVYRYLRNYFTIGDICENLSIISKKEQY